MSRTTIITDPDELARGPRVGDLVTERVDAVGPETDGSFDGTVVRIEREIPDSTTLTVPFGPKMLREALCVADVAVTQNIAEESRLFSSEVLAALIRECDRHRPLGPDGKHGQRHTPTCGCDDVPERYQPGTTGTATVRGVTLPTREQVARAFWGHAPESAIPGLADCESVSRVLALFEQGGAAPKVTPAAFTAAVDAVHAKDDRLAVLSLARVAKDLLDNLGIEVAE